MITLDLTQTKEAFSSAIDEENAAAIAQIQAWGIEEATDDPEEIRQAGADLKELIFSLNRNRIESGERPLFPEP